MAYSSSSDVAALCQNITSGASDFSSRSSPTQEAVNKWLSSGCAVINTYLAGHRYNMPVSSTAAAYQWIANLNTLYAAAETELSRTNITLGPGERTRWSVMLTQFWDELKRLVVMDLTLAGIGRSSTGTLYVGGISESDKDIYEQDTDRVNPRFSKGQFAFPGTIRSGTSGC